MTKFANLALTNFLAAEQLLTGATVEPHQVPGGKQCGCVCPVCRTPVLAIKGPERRWHFRHDARAYKQTATVCDYNLYFSLRMLARQILQAGGVLVLPAIVPRSSDAHRLHIGSQGRSVPTQPKQLKYGPAHVVGCDAATEADVCLQFGKHRLLLRFVYPGRPFPPSLRAPADRECGVLSITLHTVFKAIESGSSSDVGINAVLTRELMESIEHKHWVYHPLQADVESATNPSMQGRAAGMTRDRRFARREISQAEIDAALSAVLPPKQK